MSEADFEHLVSLMDPVCGGSREEVAVLERLLATTSCAELGPAGYDLIRLRNVFWKRNPLDAWHLYREWSPRIEEGRLDYDIKPEDFARVAILTCPRLMERRPAAIESVARAALEAVRRADVDHWTRWDIESLGQAWLARCWLLSGKYSRAFSLSRHAVSRLRGRSSLARAELSSVYSSCLHDFAKPRRALIWSQGARDSYQRAGMLRDSALQLLIQASLYWEFWRDGVNAKRAAKECLVRLPAWDKAWTDIARLNVLRYEAELGVVRVLPDIERFVNPQWEFKRLWIYGKANRSLNRLELASEFYRDAMAMLGQDDLRRIEIELDYCCLLAQENSSEICILAEQAAQRLESSPYRDYFGPVLGAIRKVVARRLFSDEVFRYLQRRATSVLNHSALSLRPSQP